MTTDHVILLRRSLLTAASTAAIMIGGTAEAQVPDGFLADPTLDIVANHEVPPGPGNPATGANYANSPQVLSPRDEVNGIGQQIVLSQINDTQASLGLCTGTLINPRTVITAAHCVYSRPAHQYGSNTGSSGGTYGAIAAAYGQTQGVPISFGFSAQNRGCADANYNVIACPAGQKGPYEAWRDGGFETVVEKNIYNGNQVWYPGISTTEFANSDIALVTLDTHVEDIPTWTLLFSPLDGPTHATISGYGGAGVGLAGIGSLAGIDYRRRSAENMIDALFTYRDFTAAPAIEGPDSTRNTEYQHNIYWLDFDDPDFQWDADNVPPNFFNPTPGAPRDDGYYDFNGLGGSALPNEGATAGGDSGGPLIVDQRWDKKVVAGVLTGSISYNGGLSTYGQFNVYPPLFLFWEDIVQNNPYVFASAKAGNADWFDPSHWVQDMDPNYAIIGPNGELLNGVPNTNQGGPDGPVDKFGTLCFLGESCQTFDGPGNPTSNGPPVVTAGGPGSTNFVPNNVEPVNSPDPALHRKARYYDVTLDRWGTTSLSGSATIDKLTIDGLAGLNVKTGGSLNIWSDFVQSGGWTNVDGTLRAHEGVIAGGGLSGSGTFRAPYLTVVRGYVAPGGLLTRGTLTVDGNMILASESVLMIDIAREGSDKLAVTGTLSLSSVGSNDDGASLLVTPGVGKLPRHGDVFTIATAGSVEGQFGEVYSLLGVLRPELSYSPTDVKAKLKAGSFRDLLKGAGFLANAFADALDTLRSTSYNQLHNVYGAVDLMQADQLSAAFNSMVPQIAGEAHSLQTRQSKVMLNAVVDRLSTLGSGQGLSIVGTPGALGLTESGMASSQLGFTDLVPTGGKMSVLPKGMSGFVAGGTMSSGTGYGSRANLNGQRSTYMSMGLEVEVARGFTFGTAFGYAKGHSDPGMDRTDSRTTQVAAYGSYQLGDGAYVAGIASAEISRADLNRYAALGGASLMLGGDTNASRQNLTTEAGINLAVGRGLTLTPRAQLSYGRYKLQGYQESGGELALNMDDMKVERLEARLGAKFAGARSLGSGWAVVPQLQADYVQGVGASDPVMQVRFAAAPDVSFAVPLTGTDRSWGEVRGGVKLVKGRMEFGGGVETSIGRSDLRDDRAVADFTFRF